MEKEVTSTPEGIVRRQNYLIIYIDSCSGAARECLAKEHYYPSAVLM